MTDPRATVVIKLGGEVARSEALGDIASDIAALGRSGVAVIVVHGGGPQATELQKALGQVPNIVAGRRVTDDATLEVMKMTVAGAVNVDLCAAFVAAGARPVGLHGASSCVIEATKRPPSVVVGSDAPVDFGHVGDVIGLNRELLLLLTGEGYVPVLACLGASGDGKLFNINADTVASSVATLVGAKALVLVTDVPGVLRDVKDPSSRIASLTRAEGRAAIADGTITKGMIPKIEECIAAVDRGVQAVHILGRIARGALFREVESPGSVGTVVVP